MILYPAVGHGSNVHLFFISLCIAVARDMCYLDIFINNYISYKIQLRTGRLQQTNTTNTRERRKEGILSWSTWDRNASKCFPVDSLSTVCVMLCSLLLSDAA